MKKTIEPTILFENSDLLVVNKPAGLLVHPTHPDKQNTEQTLTNWFVKKYPKSKNVGEPILVGNKKIKRPGIVHRIDKETSGAIVLVKTNKTYEFLKQQFQNHQVKKTYRLFCFGKIMQSEGLISASIGRHPQNAKLRTAGSKALPPIREAVTAYKVLKRAEKFSYVEAYPQTGRTHQIRVHFKYKGWPLICDEFYGAGKTALGFKRLALHSFKIEFNLPSTGKKIEVEAPLPEDFLKAEFGIFKN